MGNASGRTFRNLASNEILTLRTGSTLFETHLHPSSFDQISRKRPRVDEGSAHITTAVFQARLELNSAQTEFDTAVYYVGSLRGS